jgi:hypothetical protein
LKGRIGRHLFFREGERKIKKLVCLLALLALGFLTSFSFAASTVKKVEVQIPQYFQYSGLYPTTVAEADKTINDGEGICYLKKVPIRELSKASIPTLALTGTDWLDNSYYEVGPTEMHIDLLHKCVWIEFAYQEPGYDPWFEKGEFTIMVGLARVIKRADLKADDASFDENFAPAEFRIVKSKRVKTRALTDRQ